jgi:hypothetical protein
MSVVYLCFRAVFKFEGTHILCSAKGTQFEKFREQFADDERAFGYIRLQVICPWSIIGGWHP